MQGPDDAACLSTYTSCDAGEILCVFSSGDVFSENVESCATIRDSPIYGGFELFVKNTHCENMGEMGNSPKPLVNLDNQTSSYKCEKNKENDCLGDNVLCISRSDNTNMVVGFHIDDADRKISSCASASIDSVSAVSKAVRDDLKCDSISDTHFSKTNVDNMKGPTLENPPVAEFLSNNQSDISSLKDFCGCPSSMKGEPSECSDEQVESSFAKVVTTRFGDQMSDLYELSESGKAGDIHTNDQLLTVKTKRSPYGEKKHIKESGAVIVETKLQGPSQSFLASVKNASEIMEDEVTICDICGDAGQADKLAICCKCTDGAEHIYCMQVKLDKVPEGDWMCEECMLSEREKLKQCKFEEAGMMTKGCLEYTECRSKSSRMSDTSKLEFKSARFKNGRTNKVSSCSWGSAKRRKFILECESATKRRALETSVTCPRASGSCNNPLSPGRPSLKLEERKRKATDGLNTSVDEPSRKRPAGMLKTRAMAKRRVLETTVVSPRGSKLCKSSLPHEEPSLKTLDKKKLYANKIVSSYVHKHPGSTRESTRISETFVHRSLRSGPLAEIPQGSHLKSKSLNVVEPKVREQLPKGNHSQNKKLMRNSAFSDDRKERTSGMMCTSFSFYNAGFERVNSTDSEILLANSTCVEDCKKSCGTRDFRNLPIRKYSTVLKKPLVSLPSFGSGVKATTSKRDTVLLSDTSCNKVDEVHSQKRVGYTSKSNSQIASNSNKEENNESRLPENNRVGSSIMSFYESCVSKDRPLTRNVIQLDALFPALVSAVPELDYIWLGKFHTQGGGRLPSNFDGIQAHLSTHVSPKVLEVVNSLPKIIVLEEVSRGRAWPCQFMENLPSENNIALYFFAKDPECYANYKRLLDSMIENDMTLRANLDGVELLIFPSNVLPHKFQRWNNLFFLWGVFKGTKVLDSANTKIQSIEKQEEGQKQERRRTGDLSPCVGDDEVIDIERTDQDGQGIKLESYCNDTHEDDNGGTNCPREKVLYKFGGNGHGHGPSLENRGDLENNTDPEFINLELSLGPPRKERGSKAYGLLDLDSCLVEDDKDVYGEDKPVRINKCDRDKEGPTGLLGLALGSWYYYLSNEQEHSLPESKSERHVGETQALDTSLSLSYAYNI